MEQPSYPRFKDRGIDREVSKQQLNVRKLRDFTNIKERPGVSATRLPNLDRVKKFALKPDMPARGLGGGGQLKSYLNQKINKSPRAKANDVLCGICNSKHGKNCS